VRITRAAPAQGKMSLFALHKLPIRGALPALDAAGRLHVLAPAAICRLARALLSSSAERG
jgi:hypothetical protein